MNKCVMIPIEQYGRYKAFMKTSNDNSLENKTYSKEEGEEKNNKIPEDFSEEIESDEDYKRRFTPKNSDTSHNYSRIIPPPGLPDNINTLENLNGQQSGEGSRGKASKPEWLRKWERKF